MLDSGKLGQHQILSKIIEKIIIKIVIVAYSNVPLNKTLVIL